MPTLLNRSPSQVSRGTAAAPGTATAHDAGPGGTSARLAPLAHRRRPVMAAASLAVVALCIAAFSSLYLHAGNRVGVIEVAREVSSGHRLTASDLGVARVAAPSSVATVPAGEASRVIGQRVAVTLLPGTLLAPGELGSPPAPPPGEAVVGVSVKPGDLPAGGVQVGAQVEVVMTDPPGSPASLQPLPAGTVTGVPGTAGSSTGQPLPAGSSSGVPQVAAGAGNVLVPDASVLESAAPSAASGSTSEVVSLMVPSVLAPLVATVSAAGQVALVVVRPGS